MNEKWFGARIDRPASAAPSRRRCARARKNVQAYSEVSDPHHLVDPVGLARARALVEAVEVLRRARVLVDLRGLSSARLCSCSAARRRSWRQATAGARPRRGRPGRCARTGAVPPPARAPRVRPDRRAAGTVGQAVAMERRRTHRGDFVAGGDVARPQSRSDHMPGIVRRGRVRSTDRRSEALPTAGRPVGRDGYLAPSGPGRIRRAWPDVEAHITGTVWKIECADRRHASRRATPS